MDPDLPLIEALQAGDDSALNELINRHREDPVFKGLSRSITRLHQHVIRTRMQNVGALFERYRRTVRDLSQQLGKKVEISGEIKQPLVLTG